MTSNTLPFSSVGCESLEHDTFNIGVAGSSPARGTILSPNNNRMKFATILSMLMLTFALSAQTTVNWNDCQRPSEYNTSVRTYGNAAPCSIQVPSTPIDGLYVIKVGTYTRLVTSYSNVFTVYIEGAYHYYYRVLYSEKEEALNDLKRLKEAGFFCDGFVTRLPFTDFISFQS